VIERVEIAGPGSEAIGSKKLGPGSEASTQVGGDLPEKCQGQRGSSRED
jgi:hypothetical protein